MSTLQIAAVPPRLKILNAQEGTVIRGRWGPEMDIRSQAPVASVHVLVSDESIEPDERGDFLLDTAAFSEGPHGLVVRVVDEAGGTSETALTLELRHAAGGSGGRLLLVPLIAGLTAVALLVVFWYRRRRRRRGPPVGANIPSPAPGPESHPQAAPASTSPLPPDTPTLPRARLTLTNGSNGQRVFAVAGTPVTIGSDPGCTVVVADASGRVAPREVRVWLRDDKFMLHRLSLGASPSSVGQEPAWVVLESGDEIQVGPYRFTFEILNA